MGLIRSLIRTIESTKELDGIAAPLAKEVQRETQPKAVMNALSGSWLGHPVHPMLTDVPIGAWTMASALDLTGGERGADAARRLVGLGVLGAVPTALTGASDWSTTHGPDQRVGLVHGALNGTATALQATSWFVRRGDHRALGAVLSGTALALTIGASYLGGHLTLVRGVGVNHDAFQSPRSKWTDVAAESDLSEDSPIRVMAGRVPVVLVRDGGQIRALSAVCDHAGGPLDKGKVEDGCIECPWHGSRFQLSDGAVVRGPASVPQQAWETRTDNGRIEVRAKKG